MKQRQRFHAAENSAFNAELAQRNYELEQENAALREQLAGAMTECDSLRLRLNAAMQLPLVISNARKEQTK